jgi:hypothetical protein
VCAAKSPERRFTPIVRLPDGCARAFAGRAASPATATTRFGNRGGARDQNIVLRMHQRSDKCVASCARDRLRAVLCVLHRHLPTPTVRVQFEVSQRPRANAGNAAQHQGRLRKDDFPPRNVSRGYETSSSARQVYDGHRHLNQVSSWRNRQGTHSLGCYRVPLSTQGFASYWSRADVRLGAWWRQWLLSRAGALT